MPPFMIGKCCQNFFLMTTKTVMFTLTKVISSLKTVSLNSGKFGLVG